MATEPSAAAPASAQESAAPTSAPVVASAPVQPQAASQEAPQAASPPSAPVEPASQGEAAPEPSREPTLLEQFDTAQAAKTESKAEGAEKPAEAAEAGKTDGADGKPAEPIEAEGAKAEAEKPAEVPAPEPFKFAELEVPEGFAKRFDIPEAEVDKRINEFNDILLKDVDPNAKRSDLLNLHAKAMQEYAEKVEAQKRTAWNDYNKEQVNLTMADEELGGAGHQTAMGAVARWRDTVTSGWSKAQKQQLNEFLVATGAGSHPAFLRLALHGSRYSDEPQTPNITPQPPPDRGGKPGRRSSVLYDNNRSP